MRPRSPAPARLSRTVVVLGVTSFFADVGSDMIFPLLPVFVATTLGGGAAYLGMIEGAADTVASLLKLVSGRLADRLPRRKPLVVGGYAMATFVRPLVALASAPWHVLFVRLVDRTGKGIRSSPRDALIADSTDAGSIGRAFGFHNAMDHAGAVAGPLVATALLALHVPVRDIFLIAGIPGLCALIAVSTVREAPRSLPPPEAPSPASDSASESAATAARKPAVPLPPPLKQYLAVLLVFALGNSSDAFLLLRARELGVSLGTIPLLWALLHVSKMVWSHFGGAWSDRGSRVRLILAGWLVYSATYLALAYATTSWQVWALFVVYGAFYGLSEPAEKALVRDLAPPRARGAAYGAYNFALGMASLPAGILMGALWSWRGPRVALLTGAALALVAAVALARWERTRVR